MIKIGGEFRFRLRNSPPFPFSSQVIKSLAFDNTVVVGLLTNLVCNLLGGLKNLTKCDMVG